jgi:hypothetical protein
VVGVSYYLDSVVEEINETLQEAGQLTLTSQCTKYSLPSELVQDAVEQRLGTLIFAHLKNGELYTQAFVQVCSPHR